MGSAGSAIVPGNEGSIRERERERERRSLGGVESTTKPFVGKSLPRLGITIFSLTERGSRKFRVSRKGMMRVRKK